MTPRSPLRRETPLPTDAELAILNVLWSAGPSTVREVHEALSDRQIGYTTVLKQMQVMAEKGLVTRSERFRSHVYAASLPKESTQQQLTKNLMHRAFEGSAKNLVLGALASKNVSQTELAEIRKMLDEYERKAR